MMMMDLHPRRPQDLYPVMHVKHGGQHDLVEAVSGGRVLHIRVALGNDIRNSTSYHLENQYTYISIRRERYL